MQCASVQLAPKFYQYFTNNSPPHVGQSLLNTTIPSASLSVLADLFDGCFWLRCTRPSPLSGHCLRPDFLLPGQYLPADRRFLVSNFKSTLFYFYLVPVRPDSRQMWLWFLVSLHPHMRFCAESVMFQSIRSSSFNNENNS